MEYCESEKCGREWFLFNLPAKLSGADFDNEIRKQCDERLSAESERSAPSSSARSVSTERNPRKRYGSSVRALPLDGESLNDYSSTLRAPVRSGNLPTGNDVESSTLGSIQGAEESGAKPKMRAIRADAAIRCPATLRQLDNAPANDAEAQSSSESSKVVSPELSEDIARDIRMTEQLEYEKRLGAEEAARKRRERLMAHKNADKKLLAYHEQTLMKLRHVLLLAYNKVAEVSKIIENYRSAGDEATFLSQVLTKLHRWPKPLESNFKKLESIYSALHTIKTDFIKTNALGANLALTDHCIKSFVESEYAPVWHAHFQNVDYERIATAWNHSIQWVNAMLKQSKDLIEKLPLELLSVNNAR